MRHKIDIASVLCVHSGSGNVTEAIIRNLIEAEIEGWKCMIACQNSWWDFGMICAKCHDWNGFKLIKVYETKMGLLSVGTVEASWFMIQTFSTFVLDVSLLDVVDADFYPIGCVQICCNRQRQSPIRLWGNKIKLLVNKQGSTELLIEQSTKHASIKLSHTK